MSVKSIFRVALFAAVIGGVTFSAQAAQDNPAGEIKTLHGEVVVHRSGQAIPVFGNMPVYQADKVETGPSSSVGITFSDGAQASLGAEGELTIDTYAYDVEAQNLGTVLSMSHGAMMFVSGRISKLKPDSVAVNTPIASVGMRGTRMLVRYRP